MGGWDSSHPVILRYSWLFLIKRGLPCALRSLFLPNTAIITVIHHPNRNITAQSRNVASLPDYRHIRDRTDQLFPSKLTKTSRNDGINRSEHTVKQGINLTFRYFLHVSSLSARTVPFAPPDPQPLGESALNREEGTCSKVSKR